jgi:hypothetical protein
LSLSTVGGSSSQTRATSQPIRQIDHIMIGTGDPRELYAFFVETLQLPIGWPMTRLRTGVMTEALDSAMPMMMRFGQTDSRPRLLGLHWNPRRSTKELVER